MSTVCLTSTGVIFFHTILRRIRINNAQAARRYKSGFVSNPQLQVQVMALPATLHIKPPQPQHSRPGQDFLTAALTGAAQVKVQIGSNTPDTFQATAGLFHGSTPFNGRTGPIKVTVVRGGVIIATASGVPIVSAPANGKTNYNAYVAGSS